MTNEELIKKGFVSRFTRTLPDTECDIEIVVESGIKRKIFLCTWKPIIHTRVLGTAYIKEGYFKGAGFHAWGNKKSEFEFYKLRHEK